MSNSPSTLVFTLSREEKEALVTVLASGNFLPKSVPYAVAAVDAPSWKANVTLYTSGKCVVQGSGARDFAENVLEPLVLRRVVMTHAPADDAGSAAANVVLGDEALAPHAGVDESGKGDYFGPLAVCAVYADRDVAPRLLAAGARDSKLVSTDAAAARIAVALRAALGPENYVLAVFPPGAYNKLYDKMRNVNRILAWAHARCIEELRRKRPEMRFAISDQFGFADAVSRAMRSGGEPLEIRSRTKAESDVAVAAASILAREAFLNGMANLSRRFPIQYGASGGASEPLPKGATHVHTAAKRLVQEYGPQVLSETCKLHFRTTAQVLAAVRSPQ